MYFTTRCLIYRLAVISNNIIYIIAYNVGMGGAPIGAGGHDPTLLEAKGTGGNLEIIHTSHIALITPLD